ncbi:unnamed protein product [Ceutorhynchus assimilis]|uniref:DUF4806 domain-containing protein n=1 Tax=Ceutorhynchus assimilis TaxID=467358 RepID=A0A9N9MI22_9CUCU|nr:unnamed protein product [Ceutorhynchus assimilis]
MYNVSDEGSFQKNRFGGASLVNIKLDGLMGRMLEMTKVLSLNSPTTLMTVTNENLEEFHEKIPIKSGDKLEMFEQWLSLKEENYKIMVVELTRIGGSGLAQSVRKFLHRTLSNETAGNYSWDGAKQKRALRNLRLAKGIVDNEPDDEDDADDYSSDDEADDTMDVGVDSKEQQQESDGVEAPDNDDVFIDGLPN